MCLLCRVRQRYNTLLNKLNIKRDKIVGIQTALTIHTASVTPDSRLPSQTQTRCRHSDGADDGGRQQGQQDRLRGVATRPQDVSCVSAADTGF